MSNNNNKYSLKASSPYYLPRIKAEGEFDKAMVWANEFRKELGLSCEIKGKKYEGDTLSKLTYTRRVNKYEAWYASNVKPIVDRIKGMDELILSDVNKEACIEALIKRTSDAVELGFKPYTFNVTKGGYRGTKKEFTEDEYSYLLDITAGVAGRIEASLDITATKDFIYVSASERDIEKYNDMVRWKEIDANSATPDISLTESTKWKVFVKYSCYKAEGEFAKDKLEEGKYYVSRSEYLEILVAQYADVTIDGVTKECVQMGARYSLTIGSRNVGSWGSLDPKDGYGYNRMCLEALEYGKSFSSQLDKPSDPNYREVKPEPLAI